MSDEKKPWQLEFQVGRESHTANETDLATDPVADPVNSRLQQYRLADAGRRAIEQ